MVKMPDKAMFDYGGRNVPVNDAARIMGKSPQFIRIGLQRGILPFGVALKTDDDAVAIAAPSNHIRTSE